MKSPTTKEKLKAAYPKLKEKYGYKSIMQAPRIEKAVLSVGTGKISRSDKKKNEFIAERLGMITGQKSAARHAKKSIASFKLREGEVVGQMVTLRGARMFGFLDKFINVAIPRTKDFRGFSSGSIDAMGNFTFGVKEHTVFPETADEDLRDVFGLAVIIVLSTRKKEESKDVLEAIGFPFRDIAETASHRVRKRTRDKK
ncbi:MAG: 50S ribosomal protein L5 [Candidatus Lloydbacteria bacterium RIFCSPHIGHO2_02_FULL_50_13]|uniref:Large ribosomal subunit protein uL5 n=1 Tax=Candidatus Lloydbacteria bacterium RIFCSPHIGHO2_02_FULL_50_13 TaxID=1798661 RepID=A0A1G2D318_9BACT|nr:MAG: 50S ribosomal protein L5 [Candidatus Lloydbacteria bacterium RIFCSPHIGHO2_02_FULL_50_13]